MSNQHLTVPTTSSRTRLRDTTMEDVHVLGMANILSVYIPCKLHVVPLWQYAVDGLLLCPAHY